MSGRVPRLGTLGSILGTSWAVLEASWAVLGPSRVVLEPARAPLGLVGAILVVSWAVLERRKAEKARISKSIKTVGKLIMSVSWGPLGSAPGGLLG
eukprot:7812397-Pyramimonas_sp.AAC.1